MVKAYSSKDISFSGDIVLDGETDVNDEKVTLVDTPTEDGDGANKDYVDNKGIGISSSDVDADDGDFDSITNIVDVSVTVASGQYVLLLASGNSRLNPDDGEDVTQIWFRRGDTDVTNDIYSDCYMHDLEGDEQTCSFLMHYLDATPGTGTVTYYVRGIAEEQIDVRIFAIVLEA